MIKKYKNGKKQFKRTTCNCRSRCAGNPKVGGGTCYLSGDFRPAVEQRIDGKRMVRRWKQQLDARTDPSDLE